MRTYRFRIDWETQCEDDETARNVLDEAIGDVALDPGAAVIHSDVAILPRNAGGMYDQEPHDAHVDRVRDLHQEARDIQPTHEKLKEGLPDEAQKMLGP